MNVDQISSLGPELAGYLDEFADCFGRSEPRGHLAASGQAGLFRFTIDGGIGPLRTLSVWR